MSRFVVHWHIAGIWSQQSRIRLTVGERESDGRVTSSFADQAVEAASQGVIDLSGGARGFYFG
jgi:hypothetical protein